MHKIVLLGLSFLFFLACGNAPKSTETDIKKANEDELLARLPMELVSNPKNQAEKDKNLIINYAIDQLLDVKSHPSGIYYQILNEGQGGHPEKADLVVVNYKGRFLDGSEFDSSYSKGKPVEFKLWEMIEAWQIAIPMLKRGEKGIFLIPSALAYGEKGLGKAIPPNTVLQFEIELIDFDAADDF